MPPNIRPMIVIHTMRWIILAGLFLLCLALIQGWADDAQFWWRERFDRRTHVQVQHCQDIQYAIDHIPPHTVLHMPRGVCVISESLTIGGERSNLTITGGHFLASSLLGDQSVFSIVP